MYNANDQAAEGGIVCGRVEAAGVTGPDVDESHFKASPDACRLFEHKRPRDCTQRCHCECFLGLHSGGKSSVPKRHISKEARRLLIAYNSRKLSAVATGTGLTQV